jgi:hypothetical protein
VRLTRTLGRKFLPFPSPPTNSSAEKQYSSAVVMARPYAAFQIPPKLKKSRSWPSCESEEFPNVVHPREPRLCDVHLVAEMLNVVDEIWLCNLSLELSLERFCSGFNPFGAGSSMGFFSEASTIPII